MAEIRQCHSFFTTMTTTTDIDDAKAIAISRVFSENSRAKNVPRERMLVTNRFNIGVDEVFSYNNSLFLNVELQLSVAN